MKRSLPERLAARLFDEDGEARRFLAALDAADAARPVEVGGVADAGLPGWVPGFVGGRGGGGYGLDLSSVWAMRPLASLWRPVRRLLDLCAAPGGKSVVASRWVAPGFHLANEVVAKRLGILRHNLARCGVAAWTQRWRPERFAESAAGAFDLVLVDAPCSGQSLPARGIDNPGCFHPATVKGNAMRQRRILAAAARAVAPGGALLYSTCTFAVEENEKNMAWFGRRHPEFEAPAWEPMGRWRVAAGPGWRLGPHEGLGAGAFSCLWRQRGEVGELPPLEEELRRFPVAGGPQSRLPLDGDLE